jgi:GAF domain-containing protein
MTNYNDISTQPTHREKQISALLEASRAVLAYSSFEQSAREIFDRAKEITGARAGYVALLSEDGEENEVLFLDAGGMPCTVDPNLPMPIRGLREVAYRENRTVYDNDFMHSEWVRFMPSGHVEMRNVMFAPLVIEGKTVGIMGLANKDGDYTDEDARMAGAFGEFAAIALYNSRNLDKLRETVSRLEHALEEVKTLKGIIPICARCKKVRDDEGYWSQVEVYIRDRAGVDFSHSFCPECSEKLRREMK